MLIRAIRGASYCLPLFALVHLHASVSTQTTLTTSKNPVWLGSPLTITAYVSSAPATGKVAFYDETLYLATRPLVNGKAEFGTLTLSTGSHRLYARFIAEAGYSESKSNVVSQTVITLPTRGFTAGPGLPLDSSTSNLIDFNHDGKLDILGCLNSGGSETLGVILGDGHGSFRSSIAIPEVGCYPAVTADLRGTGRLDFVTINSSCNGPACDGGCCDSIYSYSYQYWWNNGNGTVTRGPSYGFYDSYYGLVYASVVAIAAVQDVNGDGIPDLVGNDLRVQFGTGNGNFSEAYPYNMESSDADPFGGPPMVLADFNLDGFPDAARLTRGNGYQSLSITLNDGAGHFTIPGPVYPLTTFAATFLGVFDLNRDGKPDLAIDDGSGNIQIWLGDGVGGFVQSLSYSEMNGAPAFADVNYDGKLDILLFPHDAGSSGYVLFGNGDGTFRAPVSQPDFPVLQSVIVSEFTRDGRVDLLAQPKGASPYLLVGIEYLPPSASVP